MICYDYFQIGLHNCIELICTEQEKGLLSTGTKYQYVTKLFLEKNTYDFIYETLFLYHLKFSFGSHIAEKTFALIVCYKYF